MEDELREALEEFLTANPGLEEDDDELQEFMDETIDGLMTYDSDLMDYFEEQHLLYEPARGSTIYESMQIAASDRLKDYGWDYARRWIESHLAADDDEEEED